MATLLYQEQENGNLKLVAEVDNDNPVLALDELLDEVPKLAGEEFVALNDGQLLRVAAESNEIVNSRRSITVSGSVIVNADIVEQAMEEGADEDEEPAPAPKKRQTRRRSSSKKRRTPAKKAAAPAKKRSGAKKGRKQGRKQNAPRAGSARKTAAKKSAAKKGGNPLAKKGGGGFRKNAASAE